MVLAEALRFLTTDVSEEKKFFYLLPASEHSFLTAFTQGAPRSSCQSQLAHFLVDRTQLSFFTQSLPRLLGNSSCRQC